MRRLFCGSESESNKCKGQRAKRQRSESFGAHASCVRFAGILPAFSHIMRTRMLAARTQDACAPIKSLKDQPTERKLRRMLRGIFRTKNLDDILASAQQEGHALKRTLGPINITLLGIGAIIGAGIFATVGTAAAGDASRPGAGPSLMLSFVITAGVCAFSAPFCCGMAAVGPLPRSAFTYSFSAVGGVGAWVIGLGF